MKAFIKRRWFLLPCALILSACATIDLVKYYESSAGTWSVYRMVGLRHGDFFWEDDSQVTDPELEATAEIGGPDSQGGFADLPRQKRGVYTNFHRPCFGGVPFRSLQADDWRYQYSLRLPLWVPLVAVIGWLVIRELRFREKRDVIAFFKRRWLLISCALGLMACALFSVTITTVVDRKPIPVEHYFGIWKGQFFWSAHEPSLPVPTTVRFAPMTPEEQAKWDDSFRRWALSQPKWKIDRLTHDFLFGEIPRIQRSPYPSVYVPLWLPLSAVLGWLVIRELRWREKRAKAAEDAAIPTP